MGSFKFRCVFCRQKIEAQSEWDGLFAECPGCGKRIEIRRDEEFELKPQSAPLAPERPEPAEIPPPRQQPSFQQPFPPKNPQKVIPPTPPHLREKTIPPPPPPPTTRREESNGAPKPFPKPFTIDAPKWELPPKGETKK